jgi:hypothetical protein
MDNRRGIPTNRADCDVVGESSQMKPYQESGEGKRDAEKCVIVILVRKQNRSAPPMLLLSRDGAPGKLFLATTGRTI